MNVEIRTKAAQFIFWEYINGMFVAAYWDILAKLAKLTNFDKANPFQGEVSINIRKQIICLIASCIRTLTKAIFIKPFDVVYVKLWVFISFVFPRFLRILLFFEYLRA